MVFRNSTDWRAAKISTDIWGVEKKNRKISEGRYWRVIMGREKEIEASLKYWEGNGIILLKIERVKRIQQKVVEDSSVGRNTWIKHPLITWSTHPQTQIHKILTHLGLNYTEYLLHWNIYCTHCYGYSHFSCRIDWMWEICMMFITSNGALHSRSIVTGCKFKETIWHHRLLVSLYNLPSQLNIGWKRENVTISY